MWHKLPMKCVCGNELTILSLDFSVDETFMVETYCPMCGKNVEMTVSMLKAMAWCRADEQAGTTLLEGNLTVN